MKHTPTLQSFSTRVMGTFKFTRQRAKFTQNF